MNLLVDGMIAIQPKIIEASKEVALIIQRGKTAEIIVQEHSEEEAAKRRTSAQNRLYFYIYQRIGKTLFGGDELHARRECKLLIGCRILRRDKPAFADVYDTVIRVLDYDKKLKSMDLVSVSSIMNIKQGTEYIKKIIQRYSELGVYFADIEGIEGYMNYKEAQE